MPVEFGWRTLIAVPYSSVRTPNPAKRTFVTQFSKIGWELETSP